MNKKAYGIICLAIILSISGGIILGINEKDQQKINQISSANVENSYIKWVDFKVTYEALCAAYADDLKLHEASNSTTWIQLLAAAAVNSGGEFKQKDIEYMNDITEKILKKQTNIKKEVEGKKMYSYFYEAYNAVLSQYVGDYTFLEKQSDGTIIEKKGYGLKAFLPIAKGFPYEDYDDFGVSRSYGYKRRHLGHDMMGQIGTPIISIESGTIEALGWNQYGGWRIGIRSFDKKRYYYYAHLRQNYPYAGGLKIGSKVKAGQVIGYLGHTGYSKTENVNNIRVPHLHFGIQLIFDESQKEGNNEIWIDCYSLVRFLQKNQSPVMKIGTTREWESLRVLNK